MNKKTLNILIVALLVLGAMACMLIAFTANAREDFPESVKVKRNGETQEVFAVRDLKLTPSESKEYEIDLVCDASGAYDIALEYQEQHDGGMKRYVDVTVQANGETVYEGKLAKLLDGGEKIELQGTLYAQEPLVLKIIYTMPYETGNEAQGTSADFDLCLKIQKI